MLNNDIEASGLLVYRNKVTGRIDLTTHEVIKTPDQGRFTLGAGRAFVEAEKDALVDILLDRETAVEFLDPKILVKSRSHLVWYNPPQHIDVLFNDAVYKAPIPGLVYIAQQNGRLRCFAFKGKARPCETTPLYYVPMGNMYQGGGFCSGNVQVPKDNAVASIPGWERFVLQCTNTHMGTVKVLRDVNSYEELQDLYKNLNESGAKVFPAASLLPVKGANSSKLNLLDVLTKGGA